MHAHHHCELVNQKVTANVIFINEAPKIYNTVRVNKTTNCSVSIMTVLVALEIHGLQLIRYSLFGIASKAMS